MPSATSSPWLRFPAALAALAAAAAGQWWLSVDYAPHWSLVAWAVAALLFLALLLDPPARHLPPRETPLRPAIEWSAFAAVIAVAVFYRFYRLDLIPSGLNHDVAWNGMYAIRILHGEPYTPYAAEAWGRETLWFYFQAFGIKLFGPNLFALTIPAVVAGVVLVVLCYFWVRELFGPRLALGASFLLAVSGWAMIFSRIGWRCGIQPVVSAVGYLFFVRALNTGSLLSFVLAGAGAAGSIYTYNAARLVPALYPLFVILHLALHSDRRDFIRRYWKGGVAMAVSFVVVVWPMAYYAATHWIQWQGRADATFFLEGRTLWQNIRDTALLFGFSGNGDDLFIVTPLLEYPGAVLLGFGVLWCALRPRDDRALFLILGLLVNVVPGLITSPNGNRDIGAIPFVYVLIALGAFFFAREIWRLRTIGTPLAIAGIAALAIGSGYATWAQYFGPNRREVFGFYPDTTVLGRYMRTLLPRYSIWVGGANFPRDALTFLTYVGTGNPEIRRYTWLDDITELPKLDLSPLPGRGMAFIVATIDRGPDVFDKMHRRYPNGEVVDLHDWAHHDRIFAQVLLVPPEGSAAAPEAAAEKAPTAVPRADLWTASRGSTPGQFNAPKGIAVAANGDIYVADTGNHRVQKFSADGALITTWGSKGNLPGSFNEPTDVAIDVAGNVHVVDTWNHRVQKLSPEGKFLTAYVPPHGFFGPRGIALTKDRAYVTDGGNNAVDVFDLDGKFQSRFGGKGSDPGQLMQPVGIAVAKNGEIWVVDSSNNRLQVFHADGTSAQVIPVPGWTGPDIKEAYLTFLPNGTLVMTDPVASTIDEVSPSGSFKPIAENLPGPCGIAFSKGEIYVTERGPSRVALVKARR